MSVTEAKELFALKQGYKDWVDFFINGDLTNEEIDSLMELYSENKICENLKNCSKPNYN